MAETAEVLAAPAGLLRAGAAGGAIPVRHSRTGSNCAVLPRQASALACHADLCPALLFHSGCGGAARISQGAWAEVELARGVYSHHGVFPVPVALEYWRAACRLPLH